MDTEAQIAEQLRKNITVPETSAPASDNPPEDTSGAAKMPPVELDELTMFKMHDFFGEQYNKSNTDNKTRLQFIYDTIAEQIGDRDYIKVCNRAYELERMMGTLHSDGLYLPL